MTQGTDSPTPKSVDVPETPGAPSHSTSDFAVDAGSSNLKDALGAYLGRIRGGDVGALPALAGLVVLVIVFASTTSVFLTRGNVGNIPTQAAVYILIAMGLVFVLLLGEIDLSAGTAAGVCSAAMALGLNHHGDLSKPLGGGMFGAFVLLMVVALGISVWQRLWPAAAVIVVGVVMLVTHASGNQFGAMYLCIATGTAIGILTGYMVANVGIPSFVVTLALFLAWQGVLIQWDGTGGSLPTQGFKYLNAIENDNISPGWSWLVFVVFVGGYGIYAFYSASTRRAQRLAAPPLSLVALRVALLAVVGAIAVWFLNQNRDPNKGGKIIEGLPWVIVIILVLLVALSLLLAKTSFGRHLYASGGNAEAARRAGINVPRMRVAAFAISSTLAAIAGIVLASKQGGVPNDAGAGNTLLFAVGAAVVGGTSLFGGRGRVRDAVLGGLVITIIPNGLQLHPNIGASYQYVITGGFLLVAAAVDALSRRKQPH